ncbi:multiple sugar transport system substrate-binding protein [Arcanobacterium pluranimalium]|uniref:ABC transporter substrate-binding protein n=1 Tax=Arcanobacterium pluranimalium TaxID=108028 RepID=UPI001957AE36|nr:sugar ABC transporter substrate-binding protein [Arcanobacterium pluranimalium]MBM7825168.1 multiple sugar transport system substrate-binding protein [Arcanobacterium pluranimalium]
MKRNLKFAASAATCALVVAGMSACAPDEVKNKGSEGGDGKSITYALWDPNQKPAYEKCAAKFTEKSGVSVKIEQSGWDDYWKNLTVSLNSGTAPDVITNHVAHYPELASKGVLLDLNKYLEKDKVDFSQYTGELTSLWEFEGKRFGIPQDWDTIALVYNAKDVTDAGLTPESLKDLDWNPRDGGSFGKLIAHLTVDKNGKRGDEPGFDKNNVKTYGWGLESGGGVVGQGQWSWLAMSNGFTYTDKNPFGTKYLLDNPKLAEALTWWQEQIKAGYVTPIERAGNLGLEPMMEQNHAAIVPDGSWRINTWANSKTQKFGFAPLPKGPEGRKTIINGLAPSITKGSKNPDAAWKWVKFLTSEECQSLVAKEAVVFPSIKAQSEVAAQTHKEKGIDVSAFTEIAKDPKSLAYYPITFKAEEINSEAQIVIEKIERGEVSPHEALPALNTKINEILGAK